MKKRISTGVSGLDKLIDGGIPEGDLVLLSGTCGAGKTILGLHFLMAEVEKEPGIYVSFEEPLEQIKDSAKSFGWDTEKLEKRNKLRFLKYDPFKIQDIFEIIQSNIRDIKAKRIVIDSISALGIYSKDPSDLRRMILQISSMLRKNGCTSILISEILNSTGELSRFGVEEFVTDGVVLFHNQLISGEYRRGVSIWKMRDTNHSRKVHPYRITGKGIFVYPSDTIAMTR